ncbi:MAG TPA: helix-turn-helix domain-containing protein [Rhodocyclaceae bacterium]|nr:helix-turn-helix domain-containing protein [Rhodocyclaceae bacterium]
MNQQVALESARHSLRYRASRSFDVDLHSSALIYESWGQRYDQLSSGQFHGSVEEVGLPFLSVLRETSNRVILQKGCAPAGAFAVGVVLNQDGDAYHRGEILRSRAVVTLDPDSAFELRTSEHFDIVAAVFSPAELCAALAGQVPDHRDMERGLRRLSPAVECPQADALEDFLLRVIEVARETPETLRHPTNAMQVAEEFYGLLNDIIFAGQGAQGRSLCANRDRVVRRLRAYLDANRGAAVSIADICDQIGVTRRTLQNTVQEVFGVSPQTYLKAVRLNGLRRDLKARDPGRESIGDVSARWGFWHLSQLAQDYRRLFGELPSQTPCRRLAA